MKYKKPKFKTEDHQTIWITYDEHCTGGDVVEGQEDEPYADREDEYIDWTLLKASLLEPSSVYREPVEVKSAKIVSPGDSMYILVVRYSSGDTFGHSCGHGYAEGAYENKDTAELIAAMIEANTYPSKGYLPWQGYFESLEGVEIHERTIEL